MTKKENIAKIIRQSKNKNIAKHVKEYEMSQQYNIICPKLNFCSLTRKKYGEIIEQSNHLMEKFALKHLMEKEEK